MAKQLKRANIRFALVGGLAVTIRATPRFTQDADLAVAVSSDAEAERLIANLRSVGYAGATELAVLPQLILPVATVGHLMAMKLLSVDEELRIRDRADLHALRAVASPSDWIQADEAVTLMRARGTNRGRDLVAALAALKGYSAA